MTPVLILFLILGQKFYVDDPVRRDNDSAVEVTGIAKHKLNDYYDFLQHTFGKPGDRTKGPAINANTVGEVPDSGWFQNRHAMFPMSLDELVRGPNTGNGPSTEQPWKLIEVKTEGITPGFRIRDARGDVYIIKFDSPNNPELATAAEIISTKFFHAIGFNVPENYLAFFKREQLQVDDTARLADPSGRSRRLTEADVTSILHRVHRASDGTYRVVASKLLEGDPVGPFQYFGTRPDDPNDIFQHEHRRELRGLQVFSAWLNNSDAKAINSLDVLVGEEGKRHVRHYLIDFGSTLGSGGVGPQKPRFGWEYMLEVKAAVGRAVTLGTWDRRWIRVKYPQYPSIGRFESRQFEPEKWKPHYPNPAFRNLTDGDAYWAAKIVMSFTDEEIRAVVETGRLSNAEAEAYLVKTLIERRNKIGRAWLTRASSFDRFELTPQGGLKFEHLASLYGFAGFPQFRLAWFRFDNVTGARHEIDKFRPESDEGYTVAEITSDEGKVEVYVRNLDGRAEIVGIERSSATVNRDRR